MNNLLPQTYLFGLIGLLLIVAVLVGRQVLKVRREDINLVKLEKGGAANSKEASELYELAAVQLRKRLYPQATSTLKRALKQLDSEPEEAKALIENALGFALAAQDDFKSATSHYRNALKAKGNYPVALNNLAFAKQRLDEKDEALKLYQEVLKIDPKNSTALKQLKKIEREDIKQSVKEPEKLGF